MADNPTRLDGMHVAIVVTDDFEQVEMTAPRQALEAAGAKTSIVSPKPDNVTGMSHDVRADAFPVDVHLQKADPDQFDAVLLPGGALNADALRMDSDAQEFIRRVDQTNRPIAFICHAPWLLISTELVSGRDLTSYPSIQDDVRNAGGNWRDQEVVRDRNWISSRSPKDIPAFNQAMLALFAQLQYERPWRRAA